MALFNMALSGRLDGCYARIRQTKAGVHVHQMDRMAHGHHQMIPTLPSVLLFDLALQFLQHFIIAFGSTTAHTTTGETRSLNRICAAASHKWCCRVVMFYVPFVTFHCRERPLSGFSYGSCKNTISVSGP